jgi:MFS family permease
VCGLGEDRRRGPPERTAVRRFSTRSGDLLRTAVRSSSRRSGNLLTKGCWVLTTFILRLHPHPLLSLSPPRLRLDSFNTLMANRFFLGLFEAAVLPMFAVITMTWYRRRERESPRPAVRHLTERFLLTLTFPFNNAPHTEPMRIALWYGTNGIASMLGSLLAWALSFIKSDKLHVYQILFLITGLVTVLTAPLIL